MRWAAGLLVLLAGTLVLLNGLARSAVSGRQAQLRLDHSLADTALGRVEYQLWGNQGPTVLVLHGAGGGFDQGRLLAETLGGQEFRWLAVSRFGYLDSELPDNASVAAQADALRLLLDQLGTAEVHVLAMSGGVPPALQFAERHPERTGRMVLLSAAPFTPFSPEVADRPVPTWVYQRLLGSDLLYWTLARAAPQVLEAAFDARADLRTPPIAAEEAFIDALVDGFLPASARVAGVLNEGAAVDPAAKYSVEAIDSPVLLVHARDDRLNPFAVSESLADRLADARFLRLETGGHLLLGHHRELRAHIRQHLAGTIAPAAEDT